MFRSVSTPTIVYNTICFVYKQQQILYSSKLPDLRRERIPGSPKIKHEVSRKKLKRIIFVGPQDVYCILYNCKCTCTLYSEQNYSSLLHTLNASVLSFSNRKKKACRWDSQVHKCRPLRGRTSSTFVAKRHTVLKLFCTAYTQDSVAIIIPDQTKCFDWIRIIFCIT